MRTEIDDVLQQVGGVATRRRLVTAIGRVAFDDEVRRGWLTAPFPRAYCRPWDADQIEILERAALTSVGPPAALTHLTALRRWQLLPAPALVHLTVPGGRAPGGVTGLNTHRATRFPQLVRLDGLPTSSVAASVVQSWPILAPRDRRAPAITAVRERLTTPDELSAELAVNTRLRDRRDLADLVELLGAGCESELEIWGLLAVFDVAGLRHGVRQHRLRAGGKLFRLDLAYIDERVAVEMDGWGPHSSKDRRERDLRRDAALASIGWVTIRFTFARLHNDVSGCRRDTLAVLSARRP